MKMRGAKPVTNGSPKQKEVKNKAVSYFAFILRIDKDRKRQTFQQSLHERAQHKCYQ